MRHSDSLLNIVRTHAAAPASRRLDHVAAVVLAVLGAAYWRTLAPSITWANSGADSGDLVTAAATLGVAHPTGYPTYLLLARLFQVLPIGDLAYRANLLSAFAAALAALYSAFALAYDTSDSYTYLIPVYLIFAVWIGLGAAAMLDALARRRPGPAPLGAALLLAALLWRLPATAAQVDASADRRAIDFAARALAQAPAQAIVLTQSDRDSFALWYAHYALGQRPDLAVIAEPLLEFGWYREDLRSVYPALQAPDRPGGAWPTALAAANPARGPICRTNPDGAIALACEPR